MKFAIVILSITLLVLTACSTVAVKSDYDPQADFSDYQTFRFLPKGQQAGFSLVGKRVRAALVTELEQKGYRLQTSGRPDVLVAFHTNVRGKLDVDTYGYRYGRYGRRVGTRTVVQQYREATLVVDIIDAQQRELVWRGWARGELNETVSRDKINTNMAKLMQQYPPQNL